MVEQTLSIAPWATCRHRVGKDRPCHQNVADMLATFPTKMTMISMLLPISRPVAYLYSLQPYQHPFLVSCRGDVHKMFTKNSIRSHDDYLHENIHRLQAIYKIYYPGFIEICCHVIGAKRVNIKPTKGSWCDHENMVQYFNAKLEKKTEVLKDRHETRTEQESRVEVNHEVMVRQSRLTYIGV